jgi:hypothetical protein
MPENGNPNMSTVPTAGNESGRNLPGNNNSGLQSPPQDHAASPFGSLISGITSHLAKYWAIGRRRRLRNAAIAAVTVNFCQQLSGINVLAFYAGSLFVNASGGPVDSRVEIRDAMLWSFGFGLVNFIFCLPALRWIDTVGRRGMSLLTIPGMFLTLAIATAAFNGQNTANVPFLAVFLYCGLNPAPLPNFTVHVPSGQEEPSHLSQTEELTLSFYSARRILFTGLRPCSFHSCGRGFPSEIQRNSTSFKAQSVSYCNSLTIPSVTNMD